MSAIHIVQDYPHPTEQVWRALTDPSLIPLWTATGAGARPVGFDTAVGTGFQFIAKPMPGWDGIVNCVMLEAAEPTLLRFSWTDSGGGAETEVVFRLESTATGTRLTFEHTGFTGTGGFFMAKLLGHVRRKMLRVGLSAVLADLDDHGRLRADSTLTAKP
ncbi:SRPBCC domain-containing protein [Actinospica durhamensis]|uniref:SRPBCC domain-containing protein n=1 Tax=Actinospica durhamensis TaxID=1508375 RepID=A0A941ES99_9ACTN|nr:SRPBCC domain-containing protein [Actinospica durhamensis]MBR7837470.1 SRPBCC domain-containing protein [Actinospica durhamensis]